MSDKDKVAVLAVDHRAWGGMSAQQQLLFTMQQMMGFMASPMFGDMDGVALHVIDPAFPNKPLTVLQIGKPPKTSPIMMPAKGATLSN